MRAILVLFAVTVISISGFSQNHKNDPTYSIHNYKHPNKAAYAKKHNLDDVKNLQYKESESATLSNRSYKAQFGSTKGVKKKSGSTVIPSGASEKNDTGFFSPRNYKHQNQ